MNMKNKQKFFGMIVINVLVIMAISAAIFTQPASAQKCKFKHKVKAGETITTIANLYGIDYLEVAEANDLEPPYVIYVDQVLCIPSGTKPTDGTTPGTTPENGTSDKKKGIYVQGGVYYLYLDVVSMVHNNVYNVLMSKIPGWDNTVLGRIKTDKNGYYTGYIKLPHNYPNTRYLRVCLKDVWTDKLECVQMENPLYYFGSPARFWKNCVE